MDTMFPAAELGWQRASESLTGWADASGPSPRPAKGRRFISHCRVDRLPLLACHEGNMPAVLRHGIEPLLCVALEQRHQVRGIMFPEAVELVPIARRNAARTLRRPARSRGLLGKAPGQIITPEFALWCTAMRRISRMSFPCASTPSTKTRCRLRRRFKGSARLGA